MYDQRLEAFFEGSKTLNGMREAFFATAYLSLLSAYGYRVALPSPKMAIYPVSSFLILKNVSYGNCPLCRILS